MTWNFDAARIKLARETKDLNQSEFASMIGVSAQHLSAWETGAIAPGIGSLMKIVNALNIRPRFFFVQSVENGDVLDKEE